MQLSNEEQFAKYETYVIKSYITLLSLVIIANTFNYTESLTVATYPSLYGHSLHISHTLCSIFPHGVAGYIANTHGLAYFLSCLSLRQISYFRD